MTITEIESHEQLKGAMSSRQGFGDISVPTYESNYDISNQVSLYSNAVALASVACSSFILAIPSKALAGEEVCTTPTGEIADTSFNQVQGVDLQVNKFAMINQACSDHDTVFEGYIVNSGNTFAGPFNMNISGRDDVVKSIKGIKINDRPMQILPASAYIDYSPGNICTLEDMGNTDRAFRPAHFIYCGQGVAQALDVGQVQKVEVTIHPSFSAAYNPSEGGVYSPYIALSAGFYQRPSPEVTKVNNSSEKDFIIHEQNGDPAIIKVPPNPCASNQKPKVSFKTTKLPDGRWKLQTKISTDGAMINPSNHGATLSRLKWDAVARNKTARVEVLLNKSVSRNLSKIRFGKGMYLVGKNKAVIDIRKWIKKGSSQIGTMIYKGQKIKGVKAITLRLPAGSRSISSVNVCHVGTVVNASLDPTIR